MKSSVLLGATALVLAACSDSEAPTPTQDGSATEQTSEALNVQASFYPLEYVASKIGGDKVNVTSLTPAGSDAHNLELSPRQVTGLSEADLVLYLSGFQAAMDDAIEVSNLTHVIDAADYADLNGEHTHDHGDHDHAGDGHDHAEDDHDGHDHDHAEDDHGHAEDGHDHDHADDDHAHDDHDHAEDGHDHAEDDHADDGHDHGHDHSGPDPHFWLDSTRMASLADPVAQELATLDPDNAELYKKNAEAFKAEMSEIDNAYHAGLERCESNTFVTTHEAFGYLARAYDLDQQAIAGIETDTEPSPARVAEVTDMIKDLGVTVIYATSEAERSIADTMAREAGVNVELLDALATQIDPERDYHEVMESNLDLLKTGLNCH